MKLINCQKQTDTELSISINEEIIYENNIGEEMSSQNNPETLIDHTCNDRIIQHLMLSWH